MRGTLFLRGALVGVLCVSACGGGDKDTTDECVPDGRTGWVCVDGQPGFVYQVDSCYQVIASTPPKRCLNDKICIVPAMPGNSFCGMPGDETKCFADDDGVCACAPPSPPILGCLEDVTPGGLDAATLANVDACGQISETVAQTCATGERCWYTWNDDGSVNEAAGTHCANSMVSSQSSSPYYAMACHFEMYMHAQTEMYMDCRCNRSNAAMQECRPGADAWGAGLRLGTGPNMHGVNLAKWGPGFIHEGELYVPVHYTGGDAGNLKPGAIYAIDIVTGDRRVVSGSYLTGSGRVDAGSGYTVEGEALPFITSIKLGEDGMIYALSSNTLTHVEITRVDPSTGERTFIWRRQPLADAANSAYPSGQCFDGRTSINYYGGYEPVQYAERAFALGPDGSFYLGWNNDGVGVVQISADGSTCTHVSRWASRNLTAPLPDIGTGTTPQYGTISGMLYRDGMIYANTKGILLAIDATNGNRTTFAAVTGTGETSFFVDEARQLFFACGTDAARQCSVHSLANGNNAQDLFDVGQGLPLIQGKYPETQSAKGALDNNNYNGFAAVAIDPTDPNFMYFAVLSGVIKYEVDTGNSHFISM